LNSKLTPIIISDDQLSDTLHYNARPIYSRATFLWLISKNVETIDKFDIEI